ncbi:MAG: protein translocase subunit SecF [Dehalococcoidia bacterium]
MQQQPRPPLDIVGARGWFYLFSVLLLLPGVISLLIPPSLKPGIDFTGGTEFNVRFQKPVEKDQLSAAFDKLAHPEARVQGTGDNEFIVRTKELTGGGAQALGPRPPSEETTIREGLIDQFGPLVDLQDNVTNRFIQTSQISATISHEIARNAAFALLAASGAIFIYLWWSFRAVPQAHRFGTAAVFALLHDAMLVVGAFSILGKLIDAEIDIFFITALLTVIGFSVHDSIVVFDRIRENAVREPRMAFAEVVNISLLQTLGRSFNTSLTLIFAIVALMLMGGSGIEEFLWAMLIGTVTGAYSSIFIASQLLVTWEDGNIARWFKRRREEREEEEYGAATAEA